MILLRFFLGLLMLLAMALLVGLNAASLALLDLIWKLFGSRRTQRPFPVPRTDRVSVVIPTWNGRDLLERYLDSVVDAASFHPDNEVIVVDNGSEDGTAELVRQRYPRVTLLRLESNLGFGGGNNARVAAARHDIVVLLKNDIRGD